MPDAWTDAWYPAGGFVTQALPVSDARYLKDGRLDPMASPNPKISSTLHVTKFAQRKGKSNNPVSSSGWRNPSSYERVVMEATISGSVYFRQNDARGYRLVTGHTPRTDNIYGQIFTGTLDTSGMNTDANHASRALTECLLKIKDEKVQLGTALAESVKTTSMLAQYAHPFWRLLLAVKHGQATPGNVKRILRDLKKASGKEYDHRDFMRSVKRGLNNGTGKYLEFQYGWKPLASDIYALYEAAKSDLSRGHMMLHEVRRPPTVSYESSDDRPNWKKRTQSTKIQAECGLWARLNDEFIQNANRFGLLNPLSVGWEVIPFSFLVDWGMPIGNFLSALDSRVGLTFMGGYTSELTETYAQGEPYVSGEVSQYAQKRMVCQYKVKALKRTRIASWPQPEVYAKSPFSSQHTANALAIAHQLYK